MCSIPWRSDLWSTWKTREFFWISNQICFTKVEHDSTKKSVVGFGNSGFHYKFRFAKTEFCRNFRFSLSTVVDWHKFFPNTLCISCKKNCLNIFIFPRQIQKLRQNWEILSKHQHFWHSIESIHPQNSRKFGLWIFAIF